MHGYLDFEKPIADLEGQLQELRRLPEHEDVNIAEDVERLQVKVDRLLRQTYSRLTPAQKVQVARHPSRPHFKDFVAGMVTEFTPLSGDRLFAEDAALMGGLGRIDGQSVVILGQEKGEDTESRIRHNFGSARPEGYRKAQRLMQLADRFGLPIVTLVDTAGAYPGVGAEERGQAEAIAKSMETCLRVGVPIVSVVIGEGGSGGAIAIATGDRVYMLEHAIYSVISPEGCASILWRSPTNAADAANALKLTAQDLSQLGVIDGVIEEPLGGAHRDKAGAIAKVKAQIRQALAELQGTDRAALKNRRREKYLAMGTAA